MDFMKVIDQTVREIKREVNLKVLKIPEIEQKVLDATSDEPWGPHGSALQEIAQASKKFAEGQMIMGVLWTRLAETDRNWRHVYKALAVIEYLVANGSQRAVDEIIDHSYQISTLSGFEYVEPNGKDMGINVRKKVETILGLLNSKDKIQEVRNKAATNRDKYVGVSSTGITYKSSSASYGSGRFQHSDRYGGFGSSMENVYKDKDRHGDASDWNRDEKPESKSDIGHENVGRNSKREPTRRVTSKESAKVSYSGDNSEHIPSPSNNIEDEDDFDPRGSSTKAPGTNQVDLFGGSLIDLMDAPTSVTIGANASNNNVLPEVDLFADAAFVSALPHEEAKGGANIQASVNLFAQQSNSPAFSSPVDLFGSPIPSLVTEKKSAYSDSTDPNTFDPFATTPTNNLDGPAVFGDFTSFTKPTHNNVNEDLRSPDQQITTESVPQLKKDTFQVKSEIWADSLSRGLIDLSISAPKKISLPEIGIVGGLSDESEEKDKRLPPPAYTGRSMQIGLGMGSAGFTSTTPTGIGGNANFGSRGNQFGNFK